MNDGETSPRAATSGLRTHHRFAGSAHTAFAGAIYPGEDVMTNGSAAIRLRGFHGRPAQAGGVAKKSARTAFFGVLMMMAMLAC